MGFFLFFFFFLEFGFVGKQKGNENNRMEKLII